MYIQFCNSFLSVSGLHHDQKYMHWAHPSIQLLKVIRHINMTIVPLLNRWLKGLPTSFNSIGIYCNCNQSVYFIPTEVYMFYDFAIELSLWLLTDYETECVINLTWFRWSLFSNPLELFWNLGSLFSFGKNYIHHDKILIQQFAGRKHALCLRIRPDEI